MTIYISQGRYTAAAIKGMSAKPEDRSEAVAELFAAAGARLISWYLTLGPYDWLIIAEAPDEPTMISAVLAAAAGGSLSDITTTVALTASDTRKAFQRAGDLNTKFWDVRCRRHDEANKRSSAISSTMSVHQEVCSSAA